MQPQKTNYLNFNLNITKIIPSTGTLKWLVTKGGDVKVQSSKGKTALDMARSRGMADVIAYLKTCGKDIIAK